MQTTVTNGEITTVFDVAEFNVNVGESARIDVNEAVNYIKTGQAEVQETVDEGIADFNQNAVEKTNTFNSNATSKTTDFNTNASSKTGDFNTNASAKTTAFNDNATSKTNTFNQNATDKTTAFNNNANEKTTAFNDNYTAKKAIIDGQVDLAKDWATKTDGKVDGEDYSAKYYAQSILPIASDITTVAGIASDVTTVSSISSDVTSVAGNATDISTVADSISDVNSVATDILKVTAVADDLTNIDSVAGDLSNIDAVNSNKTNIDAVAGNASNINTVAGISSDVSTVAGISTDVTAVKNNATDISTVATNISDVSSVATDISNVNAVANDLTNIDAVNSNKTNIDAVAGDLTNINAVAGDLTNINNASTYADNANIWAEGSDAQVQALGGVHSSKGWAEQSAQGQIQSNWAETDTTAKSYIQNKPTLGTMAAESASDYTKTSGLATVATSGSYADLSNKPTIPTVNNATLTIQKNSTNVATFTANASSNVTANISVPTKVSDLNNDSGFITGITSGDVTTALGYTPANDSDVVKLTGNQTIAGVKTFTNSITTYQNGGYVRPLEFKNIAVTDNDNPASSVSTEIALLAGTNNVNNYLGCFGFAQNPDGSHETYLRTGNAVSGTFKEARLTLHVNSDGTAYGLAPTPATADNSTKIATTAYVKSNLSSKQDTLVSGTNIKTINGNSLLGSGDLTVGGSSRNVGEIVSSTIPLTDAGLHLLDGALINGSGSYADFVTYIAGLVSTYPDLFTTEASWQAAVTANGVCDKFVYTSGSPATVRLPKFGNKAYTSLPSTIKVLGNGKTLGFTDGTNNVGIDAYNYAGGSFARFSVNGYNKTPGTTMSGNGLNNNKYLGVVTSGESGLITDMSNINTALNIYYYIVIATSTKTQIEVDIDEIATDLNGKADIDLSNCTKPHIVETYQNGTSWYRVYSDGWVEQGGAWGGNTSSWAEASVTYLKEYKNTNYQLFVQGNWSDSVSSSCKVTARSTTGFTGTYANNLYSVMPSWWYACGYIS